MRLAICAGVALSLAAFFLLRRWEFRDIQTAFDRAAADRSAAVQRAFETRLTMLELIRPTIARAVPISRPEFHKLLLPFLSRAEGILEVEWIPRVADSQRAAYEAAAQRDGIESFQISERDGRGRLTPAKRRSEYFPIALVEPRAGNPLVFGFDVASEPARFEALRAACDTGQAVASGQFAFIEDASQRGFLVALPVYRAEATPDNSEDRRQQLRGFVVGVFRPGDLLEWSLSRLRPQGIDVGLHDLGAAAEEGVFFHASRTRRTPGENENRSILPDWDDLRQETELELAGNRWSILCTATPDFVDERRTWWPWGILAGGLLVTGILAAYLRLSADRTLQIEGLARARADQLQQRDAFIAVKREYTERLEERVREQTVAIRRAQEETIHRLITASMWRDEETGMHIRRTGLLCESLAKAAGWSRADAERIRMAAPMHDVGKIGIPDAVLRKPGRLTPGETEIMRSHTVIGARMLDGSDEPMLCMAREIALNHHERWDGQGYPNRLAGDAIPESARIAAIVDVYDALTHDRVYRPALPDEEVLSILQQGAGTHFDPLLLAIFFSHLAQIERIAREHPDELGKEVLA